MGDFAARSDKTAELQSGVTKPKRIAITVSSDSLAQFVAPGFGAWAEFAGMEMISILQSFAIVFWMESLVARLAPCKYLIRFFNSIWSIVQL